ncbi:hypothetical protein KY285_023280 [Solanum tuberosum]|nr:hypothetical protein KY289_023617 [Solanum tuberosum]KAH0675479.1 hypothetical protein KY285_023280 [Solanum tuberosum]
MGLQGMGSCKVGDAISGLSVKKTKASMGSGVVWFGGLLMGFGFWVLQSKKEKKTYSAGGGVIWC